MVYLDVIVLILLGLFAWWASAGFPIYSGNWMQQLGIQSADN